MNTEEIYDILHGILNKFIPDEEQFCFLWENGKEWLLTGQKWNMDGIEMTYLLFEVEKAFKIQITPNLVTNYQFNTIDNIVNIVSREMHANQ